MARWLPFLLSVVACGAGDEKGSATTGAGGGSGGQGGQDDGCPAGTTTEPDESCRPAGVASCGQGWTLDPDQGCLPILPSEPCEKGQMALPGETSCRPVGDCGEAPWGDIVTEADSQHVDSSYAGADSDGTASRPWTTIAEALAAAAPGAVVALAAGSYPESLTIDEPVILWGRCPSMVDVGDAAADAAIEVPGTSGVTVRGLAMTRSFMGLSVTGGEVSAERVWAHNHGANAFEVSQGGSLEVSDSLAEDVFFLGGFAVGAELTLRRSVIRRVSPTPGQPNTGAGLVAQVSGFGPARVTVEESILRDVKSAGFFVLGSEASMTDSLVTGTRAGSAGNDGQGMSLQPIASAEAVGMVTRTRFENNQTAGVVALGSELTLVDVTVADTVARPDGTQGLGVNAQRDVTVMTPAKLTIDGAHVVGNRSAGVAVTASEASLEHLRIAGTLPDEMGADGVGLVVRRYAGQSAQASARGVVISQSHEGGILVDGSHLTLVDARVEATAPQASTGFGGLGLVLTPAFGDPSPADVVLDHVEVVDSHVFGISVFSSHLTASRLVVENVESAPSGLFGDGVALTSNEGYGPAKGALATGTVRGAKRAGVASFGATLVLEDITLDCNGLALVGQDNQGFSFSIEGADSTVCGCGEVSGQCALHGETVTPPSPP